MSEPTAKPSAEEVARELADGLEAKSVPYAVGGALALGLWGVPRGTVDVDLNVWLDPTRPTAAAELLADLGCEFRTAAVVRSFLDKGWAFVLWRGVHVDLYLPTREFHADVLRRRQVRPLRGRDAWFLSAEDLAVFKMILHRLKDRADLESLLVVRAAAFDRGYVRSWLERVAGAHDLRLKTWDELVEAADAAIRLRAERGGSS
jgi:hypothetical protein